MANGFSVPNMSATTTSTYPSVVAGGSIVVQTALVAELPPEVLLSPATLFAPLRNTLRDLDGQIRGQLELLQGRRDQINLATDALNQLRAALSDSREAGDGAAEADGDGLEITAQNRQEYIDLLESGGMTPSDARDMVNGWGDHANFEELGDAVNAVNDRISELNSENEYQMLQVNELMSKRSNLIQLVSKILGNMQETAQSIIQNMR
jgi:prefoldin subunit 5